MPSTLQLSEYLSSHLCEFIQRRPGNPWQATAPSLLLSCLQAVSLSSCLTLKPSVFSLSISLSLSPAVSPPLSLSFSLSSFKSHSPSLSLPLSLSFYLSDPVLLLFFAISSATQSLFFSLYLSIGDSPYLTH